VRRPLLEVAEVFRSCQDDYFARFPCSAQQRRVFQDIVACRTAALGGHLQRCDDCGHEQISYNSCRNRHCPKCQGKRQVDWLQSRTADLLEVPYFHIVFTLPKLLAGLALQNKRRLYSMLFRAACETLLTIARDPKHLGAKIGFLAILHTWGQTLLHHPHLHCVVPAGGLSADESRWIPSRKGFFLHVRVLSRLFQKKFLSFLHQAYRENQLVFEGQCQHLATASGWSNFLEQLQQTDWVVYSKPPFGSPQQVLKYLARYTHRVAISNYRLISLGDGKIIFRYKDYRRDHRQATMTLETVEFTRRFLLHVLPKRFVRIRHYGFLANRCRREKLALCRQLLNSGSRSPSLDTLPPNGTEPFELCPACQKGRMVVLLKLPPMVAWTEPRMNSPDQNAITQIVPLFL